MEKFKTLFFLILSITCLIISNYIYEKYGIIESKISKKEQIGFFSSINNNVLKKNSNRFLWMNGKSGDSLYKNDAIKTENDSSSKIKLNDGSELFLSENSMMILNQVSNKINLNIIDGKILLKIKGNESVIVKNNEKEMTIENSIVSFSKDKDTSKSIIQVLDGEIKTKDLTIKSGESIEFSNNEVIKKKNVFSNIIPSIEDSFYTINQEEINFSWKKTNKKETLFYIGENPSSLQKFKTNKNHIKRLLPPGHYYWKIEDENESSPVFEIDIKKINETTAIFPEDNGIIFNNPSEISFRYKKDSLLEILELQYSLNKRFKNYKTIKNEQKIILNKDTYYWRLKQKFKNKTFYSNVFSFKIMDKPKEVSIKIVSPLKNEILYSDKPKIDISWTSDNQNYVEKWEVLLLDDGKIIESFMTKSNNISIEVDEKYKSFNFEIKAFDSYNNIIGKKIENYSLSKMPNPVFPILDREKYFTNGFGDLNIKRISNYEDCQLNITNEFFNKSFNCQRDINIESLPPGDYEIKVLATDKYQRKLYNKRQYSIKVPEESPIQAPKIKKVRVE